MIKVTSCICKYLCVNLVTRIWIISKIYSVWFIFTDPISPKLTNTFYYLIFRCNELPLPSLSKTIMLFFCVTKQNNVCQYMFYLVGREKVEGISAVMNQGESLQPNYLTNIISSVLLCKGIRKTLWKGKDNCELKIKIY